MTWLPSKYYPVGAIVYPTESNNFYYIALTEGTSASTESKRATIEPLWGDNTVISENMVWLKTPYEPAPVWQAGTYTVGDKVEPTTGPIADCIYTLKLINAEPSWPLGYETTVRDNTITWQAKDSAIQYIPLALRSDSICIEIYKLIDYLQEKPELAFDDILHKYSNRSRISYEALQDFIAEQGYTYITNVLDITRDKLEVISEYLNLIHMFKGTRQGLELVLNLLDILYTIKEWWEEEPQNEPHTFSMEIEFGSGVKRDSVTRIKEFTRHYVYPKLKSIIINYNLNLPPLVTFVTGSIDRTYIWEDDYNIVTIKVFCHAETTYYGHVNIPEVFATALDRGLIPVFPGDQIIVYI